MQHLSLVLHMRLIHTDSWSVDIGYHMKKQPVQEPGVNVKPELSFTAKVLIATIIVIFIGLILTVNYSIRDRKRRKIR